MRGSVRIYDVKMAQFVLKIEKLSHIIGARGSQDLRSPSLIMAPDTIQLSFHGSICQQNIAILDKSFFQIEYFWGPFTL